MIFFFGGGRIGNKIFQYAFIKSIIKNDEKVIVCGFEVLEDIFEINRIINIPINIRIIRGLVFRILLPFFKFLTFLRLIGEIRVDYEDVEGFENSKQRRESTTYSTKKGLFDHIKFIRPGYFQSESFFQKKIPQELIIKSEHLNNAEKFMRDIPKDYHKIFVHIRRGDYERFKVLGKSTLLPISYYKNQIQYFLSHYENCYFLFLSDDPVFTKKEFSYLKNKKISLNQKTGTDFAIIGKCISGILSTSTFGWWAAYFIKQKGTIFAPKYWMGFNSKIEFPKGGFPSYAKEVKIIP